MGLFSNSSIVKNSKPLTDKEKEEAKKKALASVKARASAAVAKNPEKYAAAKASNAAKQAAYEAEQKKKAEEAKAAANASAAASGIAKADAAYANATQPKQEPATQPKQEPAPKPKTLRQEAIDAAAVYNDAVYKAMTAKMPTNTPELLALKATKEQAIQKAYDYDMKLKQDAAFAFQENSPFKSDIGKVFKDEKGKEIGTVVKIVEGFNGQPQYVFDNGQTYRTNEIKFEEVKKLEVPPVEPPKKFEKTIKSPDGRQLNVVSSRPLTSDNAFMFAGDTFVDPNKFGSVLTLEDGSQMVQYSKDFLDGKGNVFKEAKTVFTPYTEVLNKGKDKMFSEGDNVYVPYDGYTNTISKNNSSNRDVGSTNKLYYDSLVGKTIILPDGTFGAVHSIIQPGFNGRGEATGALQLDFDNGKSFGYYDEKLAKGQRRNGDDRNGDITFSDYLNKNSNRASYFDLSGIGESISGAGTKGVIVELQADPDTGRFPPLANNQSWWSKKKGGIFGGGFIGGLVSDLGSLFSNPIVQLGVSAFVPGGAAIVAGYNAGNAFANGGIEAALKAGAIGLAAGQAGNLAGQAASNALGTASQGIVGQALTGAAQGATAGSVGALLSGQDVGKGLVAGLIGGTAGGAAQGIVGQLFPNVDVAPDNEDVSVDTPSGGAGIDPVTKNPFGDLGLPSTTLIGDKPISGVGLGFNNNFTPTPIDPLNPDFSNFGGTFNSEPGLNASNPNTPMLGGNGQGTGLTIPIFNNQGEQQGFQGSQGGINTNPNFGTTLTDLANNNLGAGSALTPTPPPSPAQPPAPANNTLQDGLTKVGIDSLKNLISGLLTNAGNNLIGGNSNPLTQNPASGNNTGATMPDYTGLIGNILGQNTQINRLEDTANQLGGQYQAAAANLNKPFTPYNVTSGAGSTTVQGQNIKSQLSANQQKLADVSGQAAGMFDNVTVPGVTGVRDSAISGAQGLLSKAQGFDPNQAAQTEFNALQQLYAPQRERDRLELENRLLAQGRLGASDNPALRQLEESFRQQDLQGAIQSRNLGFQRQQELQNLAQGMFTTGSQAAQLPTQIQAQRAQIGAQAANASQLPYQTLNQQQQSANQLAQTQSSQGTALANIMAQLQDKGFATQGGLLSQAAALKNARDVAALQGLFGGGGVGQGAVGGAINNAIGGIVNPIGNAVGGAITGGLNAIGGYLGNLIGSPQSSQPYVNPANGGLTPQQLNAMSDDEFISFLLGK